MPILALPVIRYLLGIPPVLIPPVDMTPRGANPGRFTIADLMPRNGQSDDVAGDWFWSGLL
jgi:hypothetical protein